MPEQFTKSDMGLLMNIVLGIVGAAIASAIFSFFGIALVGWIGYLIAGFIGACLLIWIVRALRGRAAGGFIDSCDASHKTRTGKAQMSGVV